MLNQLFLTVIGVSVGTSIIILILSLFSSGFNQRYAAKCKYWIWLVLAFRLIIPWNPTFSPASFTVEIPPAATEPISLPSPAIPQSPDAETIQPKPEPAPGNEISITPLDFFSFLWAAGCLAFLLRQIAGSLLFRRRVLRWGYAPDESILNCLLSAAAELKISKRIQHMKVIHSRDAASPMMIGLLSPVLLLPAEMVSSEELRYIFLHELTHLKRRDLWYKLILSAANAIHWFNPIAYGMVKDASADLEISCDDIAATNLSPADRRCYCDAILAAADRGTNRTSPFTTAFHGSTSVMKERFRNILNAGKKKNGTAVFLILLICISLAGGIISCTAKKQPSMLFSTDSGDFTLSIDLPAGMAIQPTNSGNYEILRDQEVIGSAGYNTFSWYPNTDNYRAVYSGIMLGSLATWDNEYTPVIQEKTRGSATCRPIHKVEIPNQSAAAWPEEYSMGILAYDADLLCYIMVNFNDGSVTQDQLTAMAKSVKLQPIEKPFWPNETVSIDNAQDILEQELVQRGILQEGLMTDQGDPLIWFSVQNYVTDMDGRRAFVAELDYQGDTPDSLNGMFGMYAIYLDSGGILSLDQESRTWNPV